MTREETLDFAAWLEAAGVVLYGERIGIVRDEADDFVGAKKLIVMPDSHKRDAKRGTVVIVGKGIQTEAKGEALDPGLIGMHKGDKVLFNVYRTLEVSIPSEGGNMVKVSVFHAADIYFGFRPDMRMEPE